MNNAAKHASPSHIAIRLSNDHNRFKMKIQDNGLGINVNPNIKGHYGLANMKLRAERIGGEVTITNQEGTRIVLTLKSLH